MRVAGAAAVEGARAGDDREADTYLNRLYADTWSEARRLLESKNYEQDATEMRAKAETEPLWTDKYRAAAYSQLVSDERTNRLALRWLRLWDKVVFKRELKVWGGGGGAGAEELELDASARPARRVLLLGGTPGCGKTTLAHVLARHAGYRVLELNASDERNVDAFRTLVRDATEMRCVSTADARPNCIVLDEVDGAPAPTLAWLARWACGTGRAAPRRPLIAICNDLWCPALRPLRAISVVVRVGGVSEESVARRLAVAAAREGVRAEPAALALLAARAGGDVRAALSALQLLSAASHTVCAREVEAACGTDGGGRRGGALEAARDVLGPRRTASALLHLLALQDDYEMLCDGVQESVGAAGGAAGGLTAAAAALRALCALSELRTAAFARQHFALLPHASACLLHVHRALARAHPPRVPLPLQPKQMRERGARLAAVVRSMRSACAPALRPWCGTRALALDLAPLLPSLLAPPLPPPAAARERAAVVLGVARRMRDYGVDLVPGASLPAFVPGLLAVAFLDEARVTRPGAALAQLVSRQLALLHLSLHDDEAAAPESVSAPASAAAPAATAAAAFTHVKRGDVFGPAARPTSRYAGGVGAGGGVFLQYREGFSNAVRRPVKMHQLL